MKVFVAGGSGFVGSHVVRALRDAGHKVTVFSRDPERGGFQGDVVTHRGDIAQPATYRDHLTEIGYDAVVHCVGLIKNRRMKGQTFERIVAGGTKALADAAEDAGVGRFVLISANGVTDGGTSYNETKLAAEDAVKESGMQWTILRPSLIFGEGADFSHQLRSLMRLGAIPYFGRGAFRFAPVSVQDVGHAVVRSLERDEAAGATFHLCGPDVVTYKEIIKGIKAVAGSHAVVFPMPKWMVRTGAFLLGWLPFFPATNEALTMLFAGSTCPEHSWRDVLDIEPEGFHAGVQRLFG